MNVRSILKGSGLVTASAALIALVTLVGILVFRPGWECIYPRDLRRPHLGRDSVFLLWGGPFG